MEDRSKSKFINMRGLHGRIKRSIVKNCVIKYWVRDRLKAEQINLLDISIGRFGDIHNYYLSGIRHIRGIDPDEKSIQEAMSRYTEMKKTRYKDLQDVHIDVKRISDKDIDLGKNHFNIVVCNFTLHYLFESQEHLMNTLSNISRVMKQGSHFIGTTIDGDKLKNLEKIEENKDFHFQKGSNFDKQESPFGRDYQFTLLDHHHTGNYFEKFDHETEFRVSIKTLIECCSMFGMKLIEYQPFNKFNWNRRNFSETERKISSLYCYFVFVKV